MKHANAEMIKAVLDNTELVIFCEVVDHENEDGNYWAVSNLSSLVSCFNKFFVCLPQHKEACLHWLNGGDVQVRDFVTSPFLDITDWGKEWLPNGCGFMVESWVIRIKPKKEKRWIAVNSDGYVMPIHTDSVESAKAHANHDESRLTANVQYIEIEVEV